MWLYLFARKPLGIIYGITPFNFPLNLVAHKVAPAIATGNTIVLKPASATPVSSLILAEILAVAGLPKGVFNVVIGAGGVVGDALFGTTLGTVGGAAVGAVIGNEVGRQNDNRVYSPYPDHRYPAPRYYDPYPDPRADPYYYDHNGRRYRRY